MPTSARDLQAKIQSKIDEENQRKSFSTASTGTSNATKSSTGSNPPITETNSHADTFANNPSAAAAACASQPPEPIVATEQDESEDGSHLATCSVHGRSSISSFPEDRLRNKLLSSRNNLGNESVSNPSSQRSLGDTQSSAGTASRTPDERLRDKIAAKNNGSDHGSNYSLDTSSHSPDSHRRTPDERMREKITQQGGTGAGGGSAADPARHHRPSQVQEIMDFAGGAARSSPVRIGTRRVPAGVGMSSKTDTSARDERVGAFFVQSTSHYYPNNVDDEDGRTLDFLGLTEEEQRWMSLESGHPLSSSSGATGLQPPEEEEHATSQQQQQQQQQQHNDEKNTRDGRDLVCGMKKHVFVGIVVAFAVLTVAIVGTAIGVSTSSKPSPSPAPSPPTEKPYSQSNQTSLPVPSPTEPESMCKNSIVELPKQRLDEPDDEFGSSIAISRNNAVVGATGCDSCRGAAFVYERSGDEDWVQIAQLFPLESYLGDSFGKSIDIDGDIIAVGGNCMLEVGNQKVPAGCVHVFVRTGGNRWTQEAILYGNDGVNIPEVSFANSLAIDDGILVVGEPSGDFQEQGDRSGFIYIYERQNDAMWTKVAKIRPSDAQDRDDFGYSLDLDEEYLVVGAPRRHSGAAYVFSRQLDGTWLERMKLIPNDASEGDSFARSVSITQYGTIAVGAVGDDDSGYSSGSVYVYEIDGTGQWVESAKLIPDDGLTSDRFGASVAIFRETIVVGAIGVDDQGENSGAVYSFSFDLSTSSWQQTSKIVAPDGGEKAEFGSDIDVYGTTALVASFYNAPGLLVGGLVDTGKVFAVDLLC